MAKRNLTGVELKIKFIVVDDSIEIIIKDNSGGTFDIFRKSFHTIHGSDFDNIFTDIIDSIERRIKEQAKFGVYYHITTNYLTTKRWLTCLMRTCDAYFNKAFNTGETNNVTKIQDTKRTHLECEQSCQ